MKKTSTRLGLLLLPLAAAACGGGRESSAAAPADRPERAADGAPAAAGQQAPVQVTTPSTAQPGAQAPGGPAAAPAAPGAASPAPAAPATPEEKASQDRAAEILSQAERTARGIRSLEADFTQTLHVPLLNTDRTSRGKLYQRKPDRFLMRFSEPAGDVMVADGRHFWIYYPSSDRTQVVRTSIAEGGEQADFQRQFLSNATERFVATLNGEETVAGRPTYALTLVPRRSSPYKVIRVWVDREDSMVRRFEMTEENDSVRRLELRNLRVNQPLGDALFAFTPPAGTQVIDQ